ncbi:KaiC domain-containing protein [Halorubrum sp. CBA1229]|uniref:KaiC domain-containing protein n=1 Tax=Halorubrum sp. CBA1229 TaxID=1853699 RepID=UPI000F41D251|nr:KaiC domain-containing protein [Halorubrum sp. CBA1229]QKY17921.1 KaiC domain-containing protein [Halorubrum sp. CBA1229]
MSEEDDWFERALRDLDGESDRSADGETDDAEGGDPKTGEADREAETDDGESRQHDGTADGDDSDEGTEGDRFGGGSFGDDDPFGGGSPGGESSTEAPAEEDLGNGFGDDAGGSFGGTDLGEGDSGGPDFGEGDSGGPDFGEGDSGGLDFDGAGSSETGDGGEDPFGGSEGGEDDPFGGSGGGGDPFGGGSFGEDDPFGGYRNSAGGSSDDFGFGEFGGGGGPGDVGDAGGGEPEFDVDPDEFESTIERTDVGIEGLDDMILGGVPRRSLLSVIGGAGTGKTTFALQFLNEALESDRKGIYITLEQTRESILSTATEKGWSFREHADEDRLAVVAIDPIEMANSLASIRNDLVRLIAEFDADRLVLDSVSLLEMMYDHPAKRRSEVFGFTRSLKNAGVTTLLTSEASEENPYASRHGIVEYLTDAVFVLQYIRGSDFRETRLAVEIQKIRDANHSRETKPYEITESGISVYGQANIF